ncbi:6-phosphogluconolactonase [Alicyclobacillus sacchari]|uniref:6-phosphogluconolactonase n=1 Tax=Alicyclobacillus sacchari TaxID=392010 RepID=A0A4V3HE87_9BACL|nr:lactonase family protein [Alicyclobacillus sacchari]TDY45265.1 6-phosphogluconolactonase [Alicyclobacillus sacchari]GMA56881.1 6-phosphogluconolactonase [Alicyclobacillus sacchari]
MTTVFIGTYGGEDEQSIRILEFDPHSASFRPMGGASGIASPSYLLYEQKKRYLYAVSETANGQVAAYRYEPSAYTLIPLNRQLADGASPCHLAFGETGNIYVSNYMSGNITVLSTDENGWLEPASQVLRFSGSGPNRDRQEAPHAHSVAIDPVTKRVFAADLGTDRLYIYEQGNSYLTFSDEIVLPPGTGPRHMAFLASGEALYVVGELNATVNVFRRDGQSFKLAQVLPLYDDPASVRWAAHLQLNARGTRLYVTNRGADTLSVFEVRPGGLLQAIYEVAAGGKTPRHFSLLADDRYLLIAYQDDDALGVFAIDEGGKPMDTKLRYEVKRPVCVLPM